MSWKTIIRPKGWLAVGQNKFEVDVQCSNKWSIGEGIVDRFEKNLFAICFCSKTFMISSKEYIYTYILFSGICTKIIEIFREKYCLFDVKCHDEINLNCIMQWTTRGMVWLIPRKVKYQPALKISSREGEVQAENLICHFGKHFVQWITNYLLLSETLWKQLYLLDFLTFR